jgi:hypothetical protein
MAYLRHNRVSRKIRGTFEPEFELKELYDGQPWQASEKEVGLSAWYDGFVVKEISGSSGSTEAGVGTRSRPCSAPPHWTISTGSIPGAFPPSHRR